MVEADVALQDVTKVAHEGHVADLAAVNQLFPFGTESLGALLIVLKLGLAQCRQLGFPCVGNGQVLVSDLVEECLLFLVLRLGVDEEQRIAQGHFETVSVVFGELVFIEAVERLLQAYLNLMGELRELLPFIL